MRPSRHPREQCRDQRPKAASGLHTRRVAPGPRHQPHQRLPVLAAAHAPMKAAGGGKIINIGPKMSIFGVSFSPAYGPSKGGLVQPTKTLATAWAQGNNQWN